MGVVVKGNDVEMGTKVRRTVKAEERFVELINAKPVKDPYWLTGKDLEEFRQKNPQLPRQTPEATSFAGRTIIDTGIKNGLVGAVHAAFVDHLPLILTPDAMWITLTQGLATHINKNAERLRSKFVSHEGKKDIIIDRPGFVRGSQDNDWAGCFDEFSAKIKEHIGEANHSAIVADFTTTGPLEKVVSELVLMDAMKAYFEYIVRTLCGIPEFRIEGTREDWARMAERVNAWAKIDSELESWTGPACRILQKFVDAFDGKDNGDFWRSFYKYEGGLGSGGPDVSGWVFHLFPYLEDGGKFYKNHLLEKTPEKMYGSTEAIPGSLNKVPFIWNYFGTCFKYDFIGGIIGAEQTEDAAVRPVFGWAVAEQVKGEK